MTDVGVQARSAATPAVAGEQVQQYLTFVLGGEVFALCILGIKEIIEYPELTTVPMMPPYVRGVINLRGSGLPVLDLAVRFGHESSPVTKRTCIVIVEVAVGGERHDVGLVVDTVNAVLDIPWGDVEPAPSFGTRVRTDFMQGMARVNGRFVILLDVDRVLAAEELLAVADGEGSAGVPVSA